MVATPVLLDRHEKITPETSLLLASKAFAVNCCLSPPLIVAEVGETSTRAIAGQGLNGPPFTRVPGLKPPPPLLVAVVCPVTPPVPSGERVSDCFELPLRPVAPPYSKMPIT